MRKNRNIILIALIALLCGGIFWLTFVKVFQRQNTVPPPFSSPYIGGGRVEVKENDITFTDIIPGSISVYGFMDKLRSEGQITFTEKNYIGMGKFIEEINGVKSSSGYSWIYYVNGKKAEIGVSNYKINKGDIVSWKYEKNY